MFPKTLDGAQVLYYTPKGDYGVVRYITGEIADYITYYAIARYDGTQGYYLFACDAAFEVVSDDVCDSIEECRQTVRSFTDENIVWLKMA